MNDVSTLTAEKILLATSPEQIFDGDPATAKIQRNRLIKLWYPDFNKHPKAVEVSSAINVLYDAALKKFESGIWIVPGLHVFHDKTGTKFELKYKKHHQFELGDMYIGDYTVTYFIEKDNQDLFDVAKRTISGLKFATPKMETEISRYLPKVHSIKETETHWVMVIRKDPEMILVKDLLDHLGGKIDPKHVAWMLSTMYNIMCYFKWAGITHNAISPENYFINPKAHTGALLGGWWYSAAKGAKLTAVPARTLLYAPRNLTTKKVADPTIDSELIRAMGRELLGDGIGSKLLMDTSIPNALLTWLRCPGIGDAYKEYGDWVAKVLKDSFGERKFVVLNTQPSDVYKD